MPPSFLGTGAPSPALSTTSANGSGMADRKRMLSGAPKISAVERERDREYRPQETLGQIQLAITHLKTIPNEEKTFQELLNYLSLQHCTADQIEKLRRSMTANRHPKLAYDAKKETFKYRPILPVTNEQELLNHLQRLPNALGVKVDDVKDGWSNCIPHLESMAGKGQILLLRGGNKKNGMDQPKTIWPSDSSLHHIAPADITKDWHGVILPTQDGALRERLLAAGLKPTTAAPVVVKENAGAKKRKVRKSNKGTNTNVNVPMKDYSHLRK